jgi:hypothetical protein
MEFLLGWKTTERTDEHKESVFNEEGENVMKKTVALFMVIAMVIGSFSMAFAAADTTEAANENNYAMSTSFGDIKGHWSEEAVNKWSGYGIINGYGGTFRPNAPITRAEMAAVLDNMMQYQAVAENVFSDVPDRAWYADAVRKANAVGILKGDGAGRALPTALITREQAAVMLARAFAVEGNSGAQTNFRDSSKISSWAKSDVFGMESARYINGVNGNFNPRTYITRAEVVKIIDNAVKAYYNHPGTYSDTVDGLAVIAGKDVVLKNAKINGNLILAEGIGTDDATLDSTSVTGNVIVRGGGAN